MSGSVAVYVLMTVEVAVPLGTLAVVSPFRRGWVLGTIRSANSGPGPSMDIAAELTAAIRWWRPGSRSSDVPDPRPTHRRCGQSRKLLTSVNALHRDVSLRSMVLTRSESTMRIEGDLGEFSLGYPGGHEMQAELTAHALSLALPMTLSGVRPRVQRPVWARSVL